MRRNLARLSIVGVFGAFGCFFRVSAPRRWRSRRPRPPKRGNSKSSRSTATGLSSGTDRGTSEYTAYRGLPLHRGRQAGVGAGTETRHEGHRDGHHANDGQAGHVTEIKSGQVMKALGTSVIVRTPTGLQMFSQGEIDKRGITIMKDGKKIELRPAEGDQLSATIVTEGPPQVMTETQYQAALSAAPGAAKPAPGRTGARARDTAARHVVGAHRTGGRSRGDPSSAARDFSTHDTGDTAPAAAPRMPAPAPHRRRLPRLRRHL